jgi:drug/metabolite transporter (DMT)-like permease
MPNWVLIAVVAGLSSNLGNFLFRYLLKEGDDSTAFAWFHEVFRLIFFGVISIFSFQLAFDPKGLLYLLGLGIAEFFAAYTLMKMHAHSHLSISTIVSRTRLIWVPLIAFILFGEALSIAEYVGIAVLFIGLSVASSPKKIVSDKGLKFAYLSAFAIALVNISLKLVAPYAGTSVVMVFMTLPSVILFPLLMKNGRRRIASSLHSKLPLKLLTGLVTANSTYLLAKAIDLGTVSIVTALYQSMMITSVVAGIVLLKEKENIAKKIIGSLISLVGVSLLTL